VRIATSSAGGWTRSRIGALHLSGHSYREIAARLELTERTVERQLLRACAAVRRGDADTAGMRTAA
jgi:DNA-directed RNA polymerase specialized sigma24 family protein